MQSTFSMSDLGGFSPVDLGCPKVTKVAVGSKGNNKVKEGGMEEFTVDINPVVLGHRYDPSSGRIFPDVTRIPIEPHQVTFTMELVTHKLAKNGDRKSQIEVMHQVRNGMVEKNRETALVRLSSGRIVRVSMDFLRRHHPIGKQTRTLVGTRARLSQLLQKILPNVQAQPGEEKQKTLLHLLNKGRLPPVPNNLVNSQNRIVKITANSDMIIDVATVQKGANSPSKLSDRLNSILSSSQ